MGVVTVAGGVDELRGRLPAPVGAGRLAVVLLRPPGLVVALPVDAENGGEQMLTDRGRSDRPMGLRESRYAFLGDGRVVLAVLHEGSDSLHLLSSDGT